MQQSCATFYSAVCRPLSPASFLHITSESSQWTACAWCRPPWLCLQRFVAELHRNGQHWMPIVDPGEGNEARDGLAGGMTQGLAAAAPPVPRSITASVLHRHSTPASGRRQPRSHTTCAPPRYQGRPRVSRLRPGTEAGCIHEGRGWAAVHGLGARAYRVLPLGLPAEQMSLRGAGVHMLHTLNDTSGAGTSLQPYLLFASPHASLPPSLHCRCGQAPATTPTSSALPAANTLPGSCGSTMPWCPGMASGGCGRFRTGDSGSPA